MRGEEVGGDPAQGGFLGDGFGAVLAELRGVPVLGFGPGTARAVEAVLLVDAQEGEGGAAHAHLLLGDAQGVSDGGESGRGVLRSGYLRRVLDRIAFRRLAGHR